MMDLVYVVMISFFAVGILLVLSPFILGALAIAFSMFMSIVSVVAGIVLVIVEFLMAAVVIAFEALMFVVSLPWALIAPLFSRKKRDE